DVLGDEFGRQRLPLKELWVDAHHQRFLVIAAVEDANSTAFRHVFHTASQEIVIELFGRWSFEGIHLAALRDDPRHHVLDRAVSPKHPWPGRSATPPSGLAHTACLATHPMLPPP